VDAHEQSKWLLARWRDGDQDAAEELFRRYSERLMALVRTRLSDKLSARLDPEDIVQSVYRCFFSSVREDRFVLERSGDLWRLLVSITMNKLIDQTRRQTSDRRSVEREQSWSPGDTRFGPDSEMLAREPAPEDAAAVLEEVEHVMSCLEPLHRRIVEMRLQGYSTAEIALDVQRTERTVRRVLELVRESLSKRLQEWGAP
jgi:RNA polymerase sigma-70 factor (ECF subfamily)